jgi:predicted DNA-binding protein (UPF0251 family)
MLPHCHPVEVVSQTADQFEADLFYQCRSVQQHLIATKIKVNKSTIQLVISNAAKIC